MAEGRVSSNPLWLERQLEVEFCPWPGPALTQDLPPWSLGVALVGALVFEGLVKVLGLYMKLGFMKTSVLLLKVLVQTVPVQPHSWHLMLFSIRPFNTQSVTRGHLIYFTD